MDTDDSTPSSSDDAGGSMAMKRHTYRVAVEWIGNRGQGTRHHAGYDRDHTISAGAKLAIAGSSDPAFRGDPARWNPEELLLASISACHQMVSRSLREGRNLGDRLPG